MINRSLADAQGLTEKDIFLLEEIYNKLKDVLENPESYEDPVDLVERYEYDLQLLWKFDQDNRYHRYWNRIKGCKCPRLDNDDRIGTGYFVINESCPYHGILRSPNV